MNSRRIIADAWEFTKQNKKLMWWYAFIPSLLTTLIGILYVTYQFFAFKRSELFDNAPKSFLTEVITAVFDFLGKNKGLLIPAIITVTVILLLYALLPTLMQGGLIQVTAKMRKGEEVRIAEGFSLGILVFLPLLEYHLLVKSFSVISLFTEAGFALRNLGTGAFKTLLPVFILALAIGFILSLLFTYSEFFIILDKKPVLRSMGRSAKLMILSWQHTFIIGILMLLIAVRVIINVIAVMFVPALMIFSAGFLATVTLAKIGIAIGAIVSIGSLVAAAYFTGIFHLFANTVWTFTYLELMDEPRVKEFLGEQQKTSI